MPLAPSMPRRMARRSVASRLLPGAILALAVACGASAGTDGSGGDGSPGSSAGSSVEAVGDGATDWFVARSGGQTTTLRSGPDVFGLPARNLGTYGSITFGEGRTLFNDSLAGLGLGSPRNADSCLACHRGHGSGTVPGGDGSDLAASLVTDPGLLVRLSVPGVAEHGDAVGDPRYGTQLQDRGDGEGAGEAGVEVSYDEVRGTYADGEPYVLRRPRLRLVGPDGRSLSDLDPAVMTSARLAPPVIGLGLLEAIPEDVVVAAADPDDRDGDGISGRPNRVWDRGRGATALGRFGWKASQPNVDQQTAAALDADLGVSSQLYPDPGGDTDLSITEVYPLTFYTRTLAVPAARNVDDPEARRGAELFASTGCASCHTTTFRTGAEVTTAMAGQDIHPYTDLLLHDLGPDLADGRPDHDATGSEWRTPPLWGLGRRREVSGVLVLLHDGRARSVSEAILWHGGEAAAAAERFRSMSRSERAALVRFLESL